MSRSKKLAATMSLLVACVSAHAQPGITAITFTNSTVSTTEGWPVGNEWYIGAIMVDSTGHTIGSLITGINLNTASLSSYPTGFKVTLGAAAPADAIVYVYRSTIPIVAGESVERAAYTGLCAPTGCLMGDLIVPVTGDLLNSDFQVDNTAMPVKLESFSVD
ncbi:MAG TPA: hypothetical protein VH082_04155 [Rudaea sp.]|jgi:hypothetical protein|nr:hypothetical protein [Rudaea sp.]